MPEIDLMRRRAQHALAAVSGLREAGNYDNYVNYANALPAAVITNGLGQALATQLAAAKGEPKDPHRLLFRHVQQWLCRGADDSPFQGCDDLMQAVTECAESDYVWAQAETLAYLEWLKKFANAYLERGQD